MSATPKADATTDVYDLHWPTRYERYAAPLQALKVAVLAFVVADDAMNVLYDDEASTRNERVAAFKAYRASHDAVISLGRAMQTPSDTEKQ